MSDGLRRVLAKLDRSEKHLDDLKAEFVQRKPKPGEPVDAVFGKLQRNGRHVTAIAHCVKPPLEWGLRAGDIVHNARSALDHLVYQLVMKDSVKVAAYLSTHDRRRLDRVIHFPIYKESNEFSSNWKVKELRSLVSIDEFGAIQETQPYERTKTAPTCDRLWILSTLNNIDKHRGILIIDKRLAVRGTVGGQSFGAFAKITDTGTHVLSLPLPPGAPLGEVKMGNPTAHILFDGTDVCDRQPIILCLRGLIRDVRELVTMRFAKFLR